MNLQNFKKKAKSQRRDWSIMWPDERCEHIIDEATNLHRSGVINSRTFDAALRWADKEANKKVWLGGNSYA